jgi:ketosteroid isomerase-like protein
MNGAWRMALMSRLSGLGCLIMIGAGCASTDSSTGIGNQTAPASPVSSIVVPFFDAVAREDLPAAQVFLTADATVSPMFNPNGQNGAGSVRNFPAATYFGIVSRNFDNIVFSDRVFSVADGGKTVWIEAQGNLVVTATNQPYPNGYVFKINLVEGRISRIQEWANTVTLTQQGIAARPVSP